MNSSSPQSQRILSKNGLYYLFDSQSDVHISSKLFDHEEHKQEILLLYAKGMIETRLIYEFVLPRVFDLFHQGERLHLENLSQFLEVVEIKYSSRLQEELSLLIFSGQLLVFDCQS